MQSVVGNCASRPMHRQQTDITQQQKFRTWRAIFSPTFCNQLYTIIVSLPQCVTATVAVSNISMTYSQNYSIITITIIITLVFLSTNATSLQYSTEYEQYAIE